MVELLYAGELMATGHADGDRVVIDEWHNGFIGVESIDIQTLALWRAEGVPVVTRSA